jgi:predicted  nucleic acid-binding Zn-ribbon protein
MADKTTISPHDEALFIIQTAIDQLTRLADRVDEQKAAVPGMRALQTELNSTLLELDGRYKRHRQLKHQPFRGMTRTQQRMSTKDVFERNPHRIMFKG